MADGVNVITNLKVSDQGQVSRMSLRRNIGHLNEGQIRDLINTCNPTLHHLRLGQFGTLGGGLENDPHHARTRDDVPIGYNEPATVEQSATAKRITVENEHDRWRCLRVDGYLPRTTQRRGHGGRKLAKGPRIAS
jgi:hypothetical protein